MSLDMNPEIRAQWCAALRSGEYKQGKEELLYETADGPRYCCLGVLTDLYLKAGQPVEFEDDGDSYSVWNWDAVLAPPVRDWAGLGESNPYLTPALAAAEINDDGTAFPEIADLIDGGAS